MSVTSTGKEKLKRRKIKIGSRAGACRMLRHRLQEALTCSLCHLWLRAVCLWECVEECVCTLNSHTCSDFILFTVNNQSTLFTVFWSLFSHTSVSACIKQVFLSFLSLYQAHKYTQQLHHLLHLRRAEQMGEQERGFPRPLLCFVQSHLTSSQPRPPQTCQSSGDSAKPTPPHTHCCLDTHRVGILSRAFMHKIIVNISKFSFMCKNAYTWSTLALWWSRVAQVSKKIYRGH